MSTLHLKIVTPEKEIYDNDIDMVTVSATNGEIGILPHHMNLMTKLLPGALRIKRGNNEMVLATGGGFLQLADNSLTILTDLAIEEKDIDEKVAEEARKRAEQALGEKLSAEEYAETIAVFEKSLALLKVKRRVRHGNHL